MYCYIGGFIYFILPISIYAITIKPITANEAAINVYGNCVTAWLIKLQPEPWAASTVESE